MRALVAAARATPSIEVLEGFEARRLVVEDNSVRGLLAVGPAGPALLATDKVVIATGGVGGLYEDSTNPPGSFGQGLALAARAGAVLADLEFVQFHPTALDVAKRPMPLVSEAVRGEGAILIDEAGERFMAETPGAELAPRDVVARAIWRKRARGRARLPRRARGDRRAVRCALSRSSRRPAAPAASIRAREPIPVRPAQHYHMGGIAVDAEGRSSVAGLWACGEAACTGLHGANRLASNSLTEAAVFGAIVARSIEGAPSRPPARLRAATCAPARRSRRRASDPVARGRRHARRGDARARLWGRSPPWRPRAGPAADPAAVALMIVVAALRREHSIGAHSRLDFPQRARRATSLRD